MITRRGILGVLAGALAAPAIVKFDSLMALRSSPVWIGVDLARDESNSVLIWGLRNSNYLLQINEITREAVRLFSQANAFHNTLFNEEYSEKTLQISLPKHFSLKS